MGVLALFGVHRGIYKDRLRGSRRSVRRAEEDISLHDHKLRGGVDYGQKRGYGEPGPVPAAVRA